MYFVIKGITGKYNHFMDNLLCERLWKFVKSEVLNAAYHGTFDDFIDAIDNCIPQTDGEFKEQMDNLISKKVQLFDFISDTESSVLINQNLFVA